MDRYSADGKGNRMHSVRYARGREEASPAYLASSWAGFGLTTRGGKVC